MPEHIYNRGYAAGQRDAQAHEAARVDDRSWYGQGYRDGYLDARKQERSTR